MNRFAQISTAKSRGFTLVELLVVIGVIALLISVLLPAMSKARMKMKTLACASNLRQLGLAEEMYANENKGYFTPPKISTVGHPFRTTQSYYVTLNRYLGNRTNTPGKVFLCPLFVPYDFATTNMGTGYGLNERIIGGWDDTTKKYTGFTKWQLRRNNVPRSSKIMLIGEKNDAGDKIYSTIGSAIGPSYVSMNEGVLCGWRMTHGGGKSNVLFVDGHVDTVLGFHFSGSTDSYLQSLPEESGTTVNGYPLVKHYGLWMW